VTPLRPLIGVTTSEVRHRQYAHPLPEGDPPQPEMALGMVYMRAVEAAGGLPVVLPPLALDAVRPLLDRLSGLCLSGGPDLHPSGYGEPPDPHLGPTELELDAFELALARHADVRGLPVLGICRGAQALNVARGGTLHQHLADVTNGTIDHRQARPGREPTHHVRIQPGTHLARIMGVTAAHVNSFHHQAAQRVGDGLLAVAWSPDGVVEGLESDNGRFFLGVQWHAETLVERAEHHALFAALVEAARGYETGEVTAWAA
jgi:putative glutamine amidotransferase